MEKSQDIQVPDYHKNSFSVKYKNQLIILGVILATILISMIGFSVYEHRQTSQYIQSIGYDIDTLGKSYNRMVEFETPQRMTYLTFFKEMGELNNLNHKAKDNISKSNPPNERSAKIKNSLLVYADSLNDMSKAQVQYYYSEMLTPGNKTLLNNNANKYNEKKNIAISNCELYNKLK